MSQYFGGFKVFFFSFFKKTFKSFFSFIFNGSFLNDFYVKTAEAPPHQPFQPGGGLGSSLGTSASQSAGRSWPRRAGPSRRSASPSRRRSPACSVKWAAWRPGLGVWAGWADGYRDREFPVSQVEVSWRCVPLAVDSTSVIMGMCFHKVQLLRVAFKDETTRGGGAGLPRGGIMGGGWEVVPRPGGNTFCGVFFSGKMCLSHTTGGRANVVK